jgi:hypothetical protein
MEEPVDALPELGVVTSDVVVVEHVDWGRVAGVSV